MKKKGRVDDPVADLLEAKNMVDEIEVEEDDEQLVQEMLNS